MTTISLCTSSLQLFALCAAIAAFLNPRHLLAYQYRSDAKASLCLGEGCAVGRACSFVPDRWYSRYDTGPCVLDLHSMIWAATSSFPQQS
jgi:hypothetical protein